MTGILGCSADWLQPGEVVFSEDGRRMKILRKVTLAEALESAARNGLPEPRPFADEHWYEVDIDLQAVCGRN